MVMGKIKKMMLKHCRYNQRVDPIATTLLGILLYLLEHIYANVSFGVKLLCCVVLCCDTFHCIVLY